MQQVGGQLGLDVGDGLGPEALRGPRHRLALLGLTLPAAPAVQHGLQDSPPRIDEPGGQGAKFRASLNPVVGF